MRAYALAALAAFITTAAQARTLEAGAGKEFKQPSDAVAAAHEGDVVRIYPGEYFDCATVRANRVTVEGVGDPAQVVMTDKSCGGKALLVIQGSGVTVHNLTLTRSRVPDGNGAGIRAEGDKLVVDTVHFVNNQNGILSAPVEGGTITVRNSLFDRNGVCVEGKGCSHALYAGQSALLHVENSTFIGTKQGHHIKSRALRTEVVGCTIQDGPEGTASYEIEAPNGGSLIVRDSTLEKGPEAENHSAAIVIGSEGVTQPTREILIENNTFRNDGSWTTAFVNNMTATDAILRGNKLSGPVRPLTGDGKVTN